MSKKIILTNKATAPIGPYSQAVMAGNTLYVSGQVCLEPTADVSAETQVIMENIGHILTEAGLGYENVVKTNIFLKNMDDFAAVNAVYGQFFTENPPARETVQVAKLPRDVNVEISVIAVV